MECNRCIHAEPNTAAHEECSLYSSTPVCDMDSAINATGIQDTADLGFRKLSVCSGCNKDCKYLIFSVMFKKAKECWHKKILMLIIYCTDTVNLTGTTRETCPDLTSEPVNCHNDGHCNVCRRVWGSSPYLHSGCNYFSAAPSCDVDSSTSGIQSSGVEKRAVCTSCKKDGNF